MRLYCASFFFFNDTATTEIYTLSLHDALPISNDSNVRLICGAVASSGSSKVSSLFSHIRNHIRYILRGQNLFRSEEHTSELQLQSNLVCRLLLEKKKLRHIASPA